MIPIKTNTGAIVHVDDDEIMKAHHELNKAKTAMPSARYAAQTQKVVEDALDELQEMTGDYPEDMEELFEFAVKFDVFGDREDTHLAFNFFKVFFGMLQEATHK